MTRREEEMSGPKLDANGRERVTRIYEECCENPEDFAYEYVAMEQELAAVTVERDALRQDAERYRWLRVRLLPAEIERAGIYSAIGAEQEIDAAVDAARKEKK